MSKKGTYNLNFLAKSVFELDEDQKRILRIVSIQEKHAKGINQTQITWRFNNSDRNDNRKSIMRQTKRTTVTRKTVKKKLFGSSKIMGLIPNEYIIPRKENKKRYGKNEITFHLTFKGLFGALASGVPLKKISIYQNFLKVIETIIDDKKISDIIKKYYELQIQSFLLWHYIYGIQLKKITAFQDYYYNLEKKEFEHIEYFGVRVHPNIIKEYRTPEKEEKSHIRYFGEIKEEESKKFVTEIMNVFSSYFAYKGMLSVLKVKGIIPTSDDFINPHDNIPESDDEIIYDKLINDWSVCVENIYQEESLEEALFSSSYRSSNQPNIKFMPQSYRVSNDYDDNELGKIQEKFDVVWMENVTKDIKKMLKKNHIEFDMPSEFNRGLHIYCF